MAGVTSGVNETSEISSKRRKAAEADAAQALMAALKLRTWRQLERKRHSGARARVRKGLDMVRSKTKKLR